MEIVFKSAIQTIRNILMIPESKSGEFDMLAKTMFGLEDILHKELEVLGAQSIVPGRRMVAFRGIKPFCIKLISICEQHSVSLSL